MPRMSLGTKLNLEPGSWLDVAREIVEGTASGFVRAFYVMTTWAYVNIIIPLARVIGVQLPEGKREKIPGAKLKVAAVGYSRTGTYSLMLALEELGFPTFHTIHMYEYENGEILKMWAEKIVAPSFEQEVPKILGKADLKLIAESGYQAVADMPSCLFYEQILQEFPDCKFILTERDNSEIWFRSWTAFTKSTTTSLFLGGLVFPTIKAYSNYLRWVYALVNKDASYITSTFPKDESIKENAIASYEEHNRRVREVIPSDQLLEYSVKDGWEPLCEFLEIEDCPTSSFPKSNSARSMRAQSYAAFWAGTVFLLYLIGKASKAVKKSAVKKKLE